MLDVFLAVSEVTDCRRAGVSNIERIVGDPSDVLQSNVLDEFWFLGLKLVFLVELEQSFEKMIRELIVVGVLAW